MLRKKTSFSAEAVEAKDWFLNSVTFEGEPYVMDLEQAEAVVDDSQNTLVVARAGSGKTRTLVAKIIYLIAKRHVSPDDIMAFVFNANAATEINERLSQMLVNGKPAIEKSATEKIKIASTFHAFSRHIVYDIASGRESCGDILAGEKDAFIFELIQDLRKHPDWDAKIRLFIRGQAASAANSLDPNSSNSNSNLNNPNSTPASSTSASSNFNGSANPANSTSTSPVNLNPDDPANPNPDDPTNLDKPLTLEEIHHFAGSMSQFVNRAQQKFLGSDETLSQHLADYRANHQLSDREQLFLELGAECFRRYHWRLLDEKARFPAFRNFHTDFNLLVSWASQIIASRRPETNAMLTSKKYLLIDEYQDFSQLFLTAIRSIRTVAHNAKLFAVGDDWQAINRFAGSDVDYFKNFATYFPDGARALQISTNYRCHYQIVDTARTFMNKAMHEKGNFSAFSRKSGEIFLVDPSKTPLGFALVDYDGRVSPTDKLYKKFVQSLLPDPPKKATVQYIKTLIEIIKENPAAQEILFLHRNNETNLQRLHLDVLQKRLPTLLKQLGIDSHPPLRFMTMHRSKGLEADVVVLLEADEGVIPRVHPDTCLYRFFGETEDVVLDDQKRLFYVAMTRAKKRLYIIHKPTAKKSDAGFIRYLGKNLINWREDD